MAGRTDGFLSDLEASFEASLARDEDVAASDLARSFRNDESLSEVLARCDGASLELSDGTRLPVVEVGPDYVVAGANADVLVHHDRALFHPGDHDGGATRTESSWLSVLRGWAADGRRVQVRAHEGVFGGSLVVVGRDFLRIENSTGAVLLPHGAVTYVRSCPED
jgi:hypothetical protein